MGIGEIGGRGSAGTNDKSGQREMLIDSLFQLLVFKAEIKSLEKVVI